jgi:peroxiredoxin
MVTGGSRRQYTISLDDYRGKPVVVIFYLGFGCLHCVEQLATFAPLAEEYQAAGIELVAIGSDDLEDLHAALKEYSQQKNIPFPLLADASLAAFEKYRCVDNFENQALHGTFLIDANGLIRWQDIGAEPFTDASFLLQESQRLLSLPDAHSASEEESSKTTARK